MSSTDRIPLARAAIAVTSLVGLLISVYLTLYKLGYFGILPCGTGACEVVQNSPWAYLFGQPVALWGVLGYAAIFGVSFAGVHDPLMGSRRVSDALLLLTGGAFAFSAYLTGLEAFVIEAWCRDCVVSALLATACFALSLLDRRDFSAGVRGAEYGSSSAPSGMPVT